MQTFDEVEDDQFDFHSYCIRKSTLRSYVEWVISPVPLRFANFLCSLMRYSDGLRSHARYQSTAKSAISVRLFVRRQFCSADLARSQIYLRLHDDPNSVAEPTFASGAALLAKEEKKAENKAKKLDKGKKGESRVLDSLDTADSYMTVAKKADDDEHAPAPVVDLDPLGEALLETKTPLDAATKWLKPLETCAKGSEGTWELSFEVNIRRGTLSASL